MNRSRHIEDPLDVGWRDKPPTFKSFTSMVRRQAAVVMLCVVVSIILALIMIVFAEPLYTANVSLYLDADSAVDAVRSDVATSIDLDTHAELIRSDDTTATVIKTLNLTEVPGFGPESSKLRSLIVGLQDTLGLNLAGTEEVDPLLAIITKVRTGLQVARNGNTRVLDLSYTSGSPELSVAIANAFARAHIENISSRDAGSVSRRIDRLNLRAEDLRKKADDAGARIRAILQESGLFTADPQVLEGRISGLRQELSTLDAKVAGLSVKLALFADYERSGDVSAVAIDTLEGRRLLAELAGAKQRLIDVKLRTETNPQAASATEIGIKNLEASLRQEIRFEARAIEVERAMAIAEHDSIAHQIDQLGQYLSSDAWAELEDVRQKKIFYDSQYQDYLALLEGAGRERQNRPDLRIIADALTPTVPSSPNIKVWLVIAVALATLVGIGIASVREWNRYERSRA